MDSKKDLDQLIKYFPFFIQEQLNTHKLNSHLVEIIIDFGKRPEARFLNGFEYLSPKLISWQDIEYIIKNLSKFTNENRAGIERTLHRISCIRTRQFLINGLTCRIGRAMFGTISNIRDLLQFKKSILVLGKPGVGKTTIIREIARVLADELEKRVIIIDTSNEIAGDSDLPHSAIGKARRMQVSQTEVQHQIMMEAVENHMPQIIIIDEISTELEVFATRTIAEKGVQLIGTTHGNCLKNLIKNPFLSDLIGGIQYVILSDEEAKKRGTQKSILERKIYPTFEIIVELKKKTVWIIYENVKSTIDLFLQKEYDIGQVRKAFTNNKIDIKCSLYKQPGNKIRTSQTYFNKSIKLRKKNWIFLNELKMKQQDLIITKKLIIYPYSISINLLKEILRKLGVLFVITNNIQKANLVIGLRKQLKKNLKLKNLVKQKKLNIYMLSEINIFQCLKLIKNKFD